MEHQAHRAGACRFSIGEFQLTEDLGLPDHHRVETGADAEQMARCLAMVKKPALDEPRYQRIWQEHVLALKGAYQMNR